jgi:hypothetical protein
VVEWMTIRISLDKMDGKAIQNMVVYWKQWWTFCDSETSGRQITGGVTIQLNDWAFRFVWTNSCRRFQHLYDQSRRMWCHEWPRSWAIALRQGHSWFAGTFWYTWETHISTIDSSQKDQKVYHHCQKHIFFFPISQNLCGRKEMVVSKVMGVPQI